MIVKTILFNKKPFGHGPLVNDQANTHHPRQACMVNNNQ